MNTLEDIEASMLNLLTEDKTLPMELRVLVGEWRYLLNANIRSPRRAEQIGGKFSAVDLDEKTIRLKFNSVEETRAALRVVLSRE